MLRGQGGTVLTDSVIPRRLDLQILYRLRVEMVGEERRPFPLRLPFSAVVLHVLSLAQTVPRSF